MRICYIADASSTHTQKWVNYFAQKGHDVHLISWKNGEGCVEEVQLHPLTRLAPRAWGTSQYLSATLWLIQARRLIKRIKPDVLDAHFITAYGYLGAASGFHPLVVTAWGSDLLVATKSSRIRRRLAQWVMGRADYITCVTKELAGICLALGAEEDQTEVAPWGVDTSVFHPGDAAEAKKAGTKILSIRAMRPLYNPDDIARAIPLVLKNHPEARFIIMTYGCDPAALAGFKKRVGDAGVDPVVEYVGELKSDTAIADLYRRAQIAISIPSSDGNPLSVIEALACGCVPVLSDLPSLHEWVTEGEEGLYIPLGDVNAIARAITSLIENDGMRNNIRRKGIHMVRQKADARILMGHYEEIYRSLIKAT